MMNKPRRMKRVVIKEELVELTGGFVEATLLQQMLYWSERVQDFKKFAEEELQRATTFASHTQEDDLTSQQKFVEAISHGWIHKTAEQLSEETMLGMVVSTIRRYLKELVDSGYLLQRKNPKHKWDQTLQYRVNLVKIQQDLLSMGYALEGYSIELPLDNEAGTQFSKSTNASCETNLQACETQTQRGVNERAIPEITTETIAETTEDADSPSASSSEIGPLLPASKKPRPVGPKYSIPEVKAPGEFTEVLERRVAGDGGHRCAERKPISPEDVVACYAEQFKYHFGGKPPLVAGKDTKLLKNAIEHYEGDVILKMIDWMFGNWAVFSRECRIKSHIPTLGMFYGYRDYLYGKVLITMEREVRGKPRNQF